VLAPDVPVWQFHLAGPRPTCQRFQGRGPGARIEYVKQSRLGDQGHDQLPVTPQHDLYPGEELYNPRQSRHGRHIGRAATPQPPSLIGRVVCTHAASDVGAPTTASHVARWVAVTSAAKTTV